jgi:hypothetical protein
MASFLFYCKPDNIDDPVAYLASSQFDRLRPDDEVWSVTVEDGTLFLQGHAVVQQVVDRVQAENLLSRHDLWDAEFYAIAQQPWEPVRALDITAIAPRLTFEGTITKLPVGWTAQSLQSMRRLTPESAKVLRQVWSGGQQDGRTKRNPTWERDELILALDLYFQLERSVPDDSEPEVIALSELLNELPIHQDRPDKELRIPPIVISPSTPS